MKAVEIRLRERGWITGLRPLPGGRSNWVLRGKLQAANREVVVKIARDHGQRVTAEHAALLQLEQHAVLPPRLVGLDAALHGQEWVTCLIQDALPGRRPRSVAGIRRLGASLACLSRANVDGVRLPAVTEASALHRHASTRSTLGEIVPKVDVPPSAEGDTDRGLTHGDPAPWNFLDRRDGGTWVDLETAAIGPIQLDLGRAALTVAMDAPRSRRSAWTRALLDGYARARGRRVDVSGAWWTVAAGQLIAWRWEHRDVPGTPDWREPAQCLAWLKREVETC